MDTGGSLQGYGLRDRALRETRLPERILNLTDGITVRICRLLEEAAVQAIATGGERIELTP